MLTTPEVSAVVSGAQHNAANMIFNVCPKLKNCTSIVFILIATGEIVQC